MNEKQKDAGNEGVLCVGVNVARNDVTKALGGVSLAHEVDKQHNTCHRHPVQAAMVKKVRQTQNKHIALVMTKAR